MEYRRFAAVLILKVSDIIIIILVRIDEGFYSQDSVSSWRFF